MSIPKNTTPEQRRLVKQIEIACEQMLKDGLLIKFPDGRYALSEKGKALIGPPAGTA